MSEHTPAVVHLHDHLPLLPDNTGTFRVQAEIDLAALTHNYTLLASRVAAVSPDTRPLAVVKADAYGHGMRPCVGALLAAGCRAFAVACAEEAVALRAFLTGDEIPAPVAVTTDRFGIRPADSLILILGYTAADHVVTLATHHIATALVSRAHAEALSARAVRDGVTVTVHIALDTGMNRIGLPAHDRSEIRRAVADVQAICALPGLRVEGMFTHFATADEDYAVEMAPGSRTMCQYERYAAVLHALERAGCRPPFCHVCNSAATVRFPGALNAACLDGVRMGINLYGYGVPVPGADGAPEKLRPVMRLTTSVVHIHDLHPGERVGYGGTYQSDVPRVLATLPIGYADGMLRAFRGAPVTIHTSAGNVSAPIVGRICMDQCMVDITDLPVSVGDRVTIFGDDSDALEALATRADTITYEILCLITARVPRVVM